MKKFIRQITPKYLWSILKQAKNFKILAVDYGQFATIRQFSCVDKNGSPIPWYTYPAIEYLSHIDFSNFKVLEYGSGNSTLWWASRCLEIRSIEHDEEWFKQINNSGNGSNITNYFLEKDKRGYIEQEYTQKANIVIIDGVYRSLCADYVNNVIKNNQHNISMIVFDNSDWYPQTIQKLNRELGWIQVDFHGFTPINGYTATTSIFINTSAAQTIKYKKQLMSINAVVENSINNPDDIIA